MSKKEKIRQILTFEKGKKKSYYIRIFENDCSMPEPVEISITKINNGTEDLNFIMFSCIRNETGCPKGLKENDYCEILKRKL